MDATTSCVARGWNNGKLRLECKEQRGQQVLLGVTCYLIISWGGVSCFIWDVVVYTRYSHLSNVLRKIALTEKFYLIPTEEYVLWRQMIIHLLSIVKVMQKYPLCICLKSKIWKILFFLIFEVYQNALILLFPISSILTPLHSYRVDSVW